MIDNDKRKKSNRVINYKEDNKYAIIISHSEKRQGVKAKFSDGTSYTEHQYALMTAGKLFDVADVFTHDGYNRGYCSMCKRTAVRIKGTKKRYDLIVALHFNAGSKPIFNGALALYYAGNSNTRLLSKSFTKDMEESLGIKSRYSRAVTSKYDRGFCEIAYPRDWAMILEPFFSTSNLDLRLMEGHNEEYTQVIRRLFMKASYIKDHQ